VKNRQRFNFGVIYPRSFSESQGGADPWTMQTECLVMGNEDTQCMVRVKFLRMVERSIEKVLRPLSNLSSITAENVETVERLVIDDKIYQEWQEAVEEEIAVTEFNLAALVDRPMQWPLRLSANRENEAIQDVGGLIAGIIQRHKASISGTIEFAAVRLDKSVFRLTVRIANDSRFESAARVEREQALARSLVSAHTILEARGGEFVSLADPPEAFREYAKSCQNVGTWPVLVGEAGQRDTMLSSPIILYDYPELAPESPGDLFDGAEIDEILSLRIMTLTEEEKSEMRQSDERARMILERTESLPDEQFMKLHGVLRGLRNSKEETP
jgi:hydrogenase maturation protease